MGTGGSRSATRRTGRGRSPRTRSVGVRLGYGPIPAGATLLPDLRAGWPGRLPSAPWRWPTSSSSSLPFSRSRWFCSTPGSTSRQRTEPAPRASTRTGSPAAFTVGLMHRPWDERRRRDLPSARRSPGRRSSHPSALRRASHCRRPPVHLVAAAARCVRGGLQDADRPLGPGPRWFGSGRHCRSGQSVSGPEQYTQSSSHVGAPSRASRDGRVAIMVIKEVIPGRRAPRPTDACGGLQVGSP